MPNKLLKLEFEYEKNGRRIVRRSLESSDLTARAELKDAGFTVSVTPYEKLRWKRVTATFLADFKEDEIYFLNGYQSWTECREVTKDDRIRGIKPLASLIAPARKICSWFGDYSFRDYGKKGVFHGYTYAYRRHGDRVVLYGSRSEDTGFTVFTFDTGADTVTVERELDGFETAEAFTAIEIDRYAGTFDAVFDRYFRDAGVKPPRLDRLNGYTSWYNYFQKIDREILLRDLDAIAEVAPKPDLFQTDDGWQTAVGDWLSVDRKKFPNGISEIADAAHAKGMLAGLWLAPFLAERKSELVKLHPDWILRDEKGRPRMGNIGWSGAYILDFYNEAFREYLKEVFTAVLKRDGFDLVKLDFLYAVCLYPQNARSRGQIMAEAMAFLRELTGAKLLLGCGVPLGSAFGRADFCRISADVDLSYRSRFLSKHANREIVSTRSALTNTVFRRQLDGRAFGNDPDVFFLRNHNLKFSEKEKATLQTVNRLMGSVKFISDNAAEYGAREREQLQEAFVTEKTKIVRAEMAGKSKIEIVYQEGGAEKMLEIPLK